MKELMKALSDFQQECPVIKKLETAKVVTKTGGSYSYNYAGLPSILEVINPLLVKNGLVITQPLEILDGERRVKTFLYHIESGENLESTMIVPQVTFTGMNDYQALGSGITYIRRYALSSILGIVTDEDNDGAAGQGSKINTIENLLVSCSLSDEEKKRIEIELVDLDANRTERCIAYLMANQRDPIESGDNYKLRDINKKLNEKGA
jgi:hypothetical protein